VLYRVLAGKPEGKQCCGDPNVDGRIISKCIFKKCDVELWTGLSWFSVGTGGGHL
jgi:hypothetical protein